MKDTISETAKPKGKARQVTVTADESGVRLDRWFKRHFAALTHGQLQKLLRSGQIRIDGKRADAADRLQAGQILRLPPQFQHHHFDAPAPGTPRPMRNADKLKDMILFEDDDVVVLNKPAGLAVQGGTGLKENLDDALLVLSRDGKAKPKLVHRLDRDTSGVLLIARTDYAAAQLAESFRDRATQKIYWAVTLGVPKPPRGRIEAPLIKRGEIMVVADEDIDDEAKRAVTHYAMVEKARTQAAFVALLPVTGRTHQLRVHLQHIGAPILGDRLYNHKDPDGLPLAELGTGLHLHARRLMIPHPRHGTIDVTAPLGPAMQKTFRWFHFDEQAVTDFDAD